MKRLLILVMSVLLLQTVQAQLTDFIPYRSKVKHIGIAADSLLYIPVKDTTHTPGTLGALTRRPQDSLIYIGIKTTAGGKRWDLFGNWIGEVSAGISALGNSPFGLTKPNDSTYTADSTKLWTKYAGEKARDSLAALIALKLNITDTANMRVRLYEGSNITITGTYPNLTISSTGGGSSDSSIIYIDTTFTRLARVINTDTLLFKSQRFRLNGVTTNPSSTDSTESWDFSVIVPADTANKWITSIYRKTASDSVFGIIGGTHTFLYKDSIGAGGGGDYPAPPNPDTPNNWLIIPDKKNPIFSVANMGGVVALESSMYAPSPASINDTLFWVFAKGDATNSIHYFESRDSMRTWIYKDTALFPSPSPAWDSVDNAFPLFIYNNVTDTGYLFYTGGKGIGGPEYGLGLIAFKVSGATFPLTRPSAPFLSNARAATLLGESVGFIDVSSMVKKDGKHFFFGSYSHGDSVFLWAGKGADWRNIDSMWRIQSPNTALGYNGIINPTVYKRGSLYYGIFADSRVDADNVRDTSKSMLASMYSADLITWTRLPNFFLTPRGDTSWWGKQIYDMQLLKVNGGNYDEPYKLKRDTTWGGPSKDQNEGFYYGFVSGSYFGCCLDQSGIVYILPQEEGYMNFGVTDLPVRNDISFYQRNNTLALNIPVATSQVSGKLSNTDWTTFNNKAPASGSANYINNQFSTPQDASFNIDSVGYIGRKLTVGGTNADYVMNVDGYLNSGNVLNLRNASNFGINQLTTVTTEVTQLWNGAGEGYLNMFTSGGAINERFYKKNFQPVYSPFSAFMTLYGKQTDAIRVEINGGNPTGFGLSRTANGTALSINQTDGYNTTSGALTSYGIVSNNTSSRESGSNALTNYAGRFVSSGGQNNYSLSLGNPAQYEANYGSLFTTRSLVDKGYVDSAIIAGGGGGGTVYVDSVYINGSDDSLIVHKNGNRYAYELPAGGGGSGWGLSGNSITAGVDFIGTTNNTSMRFYTNNTLRMQLDSNGNIVQSASNPVYGNVKFQQRYSGSGSDYYWFADDPFNTTVHYMRGDGAAYHAAGIALGASKFTVDANGNITKINNVTTSFPSSQGSANTVLTNNGSGTLTWSGSVASSGEYTPTETDITNVASSTSNLATYIRVGDYVHVSGSISITATSASTLTEIEITLPVASALSSSFELNGTAGTDTVFGYVYGNSTSDKAKIAFVSPATGSPGDVRYTFSYKITPP